MVKIIFFINMKGFDKCLSCGEETKNKKYCNDKCKQKYYYSTNSDLREKKKLDIKNKRKEISIRSSRCRMRLLPAQRG